LANKTYAAALEAYRTQDYATALTNFNALAEHYPDVQVLLAAMHRNGEGTPVDHGEAEKWTRLAADNGNAEAQHIMGLIHDDGALVSKDHSEALRWYRLAAQKGFANAQINVGHCFHEGLGVERDESLAAWWVAQAAEQGDTEAQFHLGSRYIHGIGVEKIDFDAFFWLDLVAKGGNADAIAARKGIDQRVEPDALGQLERDSASLNWKPKTSEDSAFEIFAFAARQTVLQLRTILGDERFDALKTTERKAPTVGEVILKDTHGHTLPTIAANLQKHLAELDQFIDAKVGPTDDRSPSAYGILGFIRRIDDLADVGNVVGERTADLTYNLMEYHLSLVRELEACIDSETIETLLQRFSIKQGLRASRLTSYAGLHKVLLPIFPW
jgi:hypothetical protein